LSELRGCFRNSRLMFFVLEVYDVIDPRKIARNAALICLVGADFTNEEMIRVFETESFPVGLLSFRFCG